MIYVAPDGSKTCDDIMLERSLIETALLSECSSAVAPSGGTCAPLSNDCAQSNQDPTQFGITIDVC